jgi:hypothetical protein
LGNGSITDYDFIGASNCSKLLETAAAFFSRSLQSYGGRSALSIAAAQ